MTSMDIELTNRARVESQSWTSKTQSLEDAAAEITALGNKTDDITLQTALKAVALKNRILAGESAHSFKGTDKTDRTQHPRIWLSESRPG